MSSGVTDVTKEHLVYGEWTLTYLALGVVRWGGEGSSGRGGGNEGDGGLGKAIVRLE